MVIRCYLYSFKAWACQKGGKKWSIDACLYYCHAFSLFLSSFFISIFFFFFTYLLLLSFLLLSFRVLVLPSMAISSFYSELIQWDFSLLSLRLHQPLLVSCGYSFKTTHNPLVAQPLPLLKVCLLLHSLF